MNLITDIFSKLPDRDAGPDEPLGAGAEADRADGGDPVVDVTGGLALLLLFGVLPAGGLFRDRPGLGGLLGRERQVVQGPLPVIRGDDAVLRRDPEDRIGLVADRFGL